VTDVLMPALSPTMEEGTLSKWNIKEGDTVKAGDVIAEIETDKATMEVEAVDEGVVDAILVPAGTENVKVNAPIARLKGDGESAAPPPQSLRDSSPKGGASEDATPKTSPSGGGGREADGGAKPPPAIQRNSRLKPPSPPRKAQPPSPRPRR